MIYGYLLLIVLAVSIVFQIYRTLLRPNGAGSAVGQPFNVSKLRAPELRLQYKFNFATAVNFERNGRASGVSQSEAKDAIDKCILIRHRLDITEGNIPLGGGNKSLNGYRSEIMIDIRDAAAGGQA